MGYSLSHKKYKCLDLKEQRVYISRHVLFNEGYFPFSGTKDQNSHSSSLTSYATLHAKPPLLFNYASSQHTSTLNQQYCAPAIAVVPFESFGPLNSAEQICIPSVYTDQFHSPIADHSSFDQHSPALQSTSGHSFETAPVTSDTPASTGDNISDPAARVPPTNQHSTTARAKSGIFKLKVLLAHFEPSTITDALNDKEWIQAMTEEFQALQRNKTWTLVPLPPNRKATECKRVFRRKENADGTVQRYKARLVAMGFSQQEESDYSETFSPVVKPTTIHTILIISLAHNW